MAEAFGTGASIVGVIGLAIQITQVVGQFWTDWKDAPENVKTFIVELGTLRTVLSETNANILLNPDFEAAFQNRPSLILSQLGSNAPSTTDANRMLEICRKELSSMLAKLGKRAQGSRLGWERFKEAFLTKDTRESVENLYRQCQALNNMLSIDAIVLGASMYKEVKEERKEQHEWRQADEQISLAIRVGIDESNRRQERQQRKHKRQAILEWLTPIDYATLQSDYIGRRQAKTGQWLLDSAEFHAWVEADRQILFCPGIPGAGKTILTSIVVDELTTRFHDDKSVSIAYLYCDVKRKDDQTAHKLLASLLKQLSQKRSPLPSRVKSLYDEHKDKRTQLSLDEILRVLRSVAVKYSRVFIIVDALDECEPSDGSRHRLLSSLFDLSAKCKANLLITSRPIPSIENEFEGGMKLEISASEEDVQRYLEGHMFRLPGYVVRSPELQEEIKAHIVEAVEGMFLLAELHLKSLIGKRSPKALRTALKNLATGSGAYDKAYENAMERITGQVKDQEELAIQVLSWITCAKRLLRVSELQHALAVEIGESQLDNGNLPDIVDMVSVCAGLVTVDSESDIIRLVHYTTQDYFERNQSRWFPSAEKTIAATCITYLSFDIFKGDAFAVQTEMSDERVFMLYFDHPLFLYAAQYWGYHACRGPEINLLDLVLDFLEQAPKFAYSVMQNLIYRYGAAGRRTAAIAPKVQIAASFGLKKTLEVLLEGGADIEAQSSDGWTALGSAAWNGQEEVIGLLLEHGANIEAENNDGWTALANACRNGHFGAIRKLLAKGANIETKNKRGWTPLLGAAWRGQEFVVRLLLQEGADTEAKNNDGWTSLHQAASHGDNIMIKVLLDEGARVDARSGWGWTPLMSAATARTSDEHTIQLLLDAGSDRAAKDTRGETAYDKAEQHSKETIMYLLR